MRKIFLIIIGIILSLVSIELTLRAGSFFYTSISEMRNRIGLKRAGVCRVLCIGESTTMGAYPRFLELSLNRKSRDVKFKVIDKGMRGTNTSIILNELPEYLKYYRPHFVVAMMGINDISYNLVCEKNNFIKEMKLYKLLRIIYLHLKKPVARETGKEPISGQQLHLDVNLDHPARPLDNVLEPILKNIRDGMDYVQIKNTLNELKVRYPHESGIYIELAELELAHNKEQDYLKEALRYAGGDKSIYREIILLYLRYGYVAEAENIIIKYLYGKCEGEEAYWVDLKLASIYSRTKRPQEALKLFKKAELMHPESTALLCTSADVMEALGMTKEAEENIHKALVLEPDNQLTIGKAALFYMNTGNEKLAKEYFNRYEMSRNELCKYITRANYNKVVALVKNANAKMICMEYPMRKLEPLISMLDNDKEILFIDNENTFKQAVKKEGYDAIFVDNFAQVFGHCTNRGNELIAENLSDRILEHFYRE